MQVFEGGTTTVDTLLFGVPNQNVINYVTNEFNNFISMIGDKGRSFYDSAINKIDDLINGDVINKAKAILKSATDVLSHIDIVKFTNKLEEFQTATPYMQRWLMAEESMYDMFKSQRCVAFQVDDNTSWLDNDPGVEGRFRYDSMLINTGMVNFNNDDKSFSVTEFELHDEMQLRNESPLTFSEKATILDMHSWVKYYISQGKDPSDPLGGLL